MTSDDGERFPTARLADLCDDTRPITYGIVNLIAEPGHSAIVPDTLAGANVTRDVAVIAVTGADTRFVNYFLQSTQCVGWLRAHLQGSVTLKINLGTLAALPVPVPPAGEQRRIAEVLAALDDKIDSNRRLAGLLEEMAATLFHAQFVDFAGVEELEDSEIGPVPPGWRTGSLTDLARFVNGKAFTKHANGYGRPILRIRELNDGVDDATPHSDIEAADDFIARFDDILFAWSGSLGVHRWPGEESLINQHIFKVIPGRWPSWFAFAWITEHMATFRQIARDKATTMGHIQRKHLDEARVPLPTIETIAEADAVFAPLDRYRANLVGESRTLALVRNALLPKLISGQIRVTDTADNAEVIEAAAEAIAASS
jgi:type I restriction enzyme S subunit